MNKLNLGCGKNPLKGWINLDLKLPSGFSASDPEYTFTGFNLELCAKEIRLPFEDDTFDQIYSAHTLEHIRGILPLMQELHRVAKPDCQFTAVVPYGSFNAAFEDPTHVRQFFESSWLYFSQTAYGAADYGYRGDWKTTGLAFSIIKDSLPEMNVTDQEILGAIRTLRNICDEMVAYMIAVKPARPAGTGIYRPMTKITKSKVNYRPGVHIEIER